MGKIAVGDIFVSQILPNDIYVVKKVLGYDNKVEISKLNGLKTFIRPVFEYKNQLRISIAEWEQAILYKKYETTQQKEIDNGGL